MSQLVMAVFRDRDQALAAVEALVRHGVDAGAIGLLATGPERFGQLRNPNVVQQAGQATSLRAGKGPFAEPDDGAYGQSPGYALHDIRELQIQGMGPVVAAGPLGAALTASPAWPAERAIQDAFVRRGIDSAHARVACEELHRGGILISVHDADPKRARAVLERYGPVDLQTEGRPGGP